MPEDLKKSAGAATVEADKKAEAELDTPLATLSEVFSFAESRKTRVYLALGLFWAAVAGLALPISILYFARIMGDISAIGQEGIGPVVDIIYAMMILGVVSLVAETAQSKLRLASIYNLCDVRRDQI